ncbi:MAG: helix-turn-helix transcriptional regulator [Bacteroidales bacterium]
MDAEITFGDTIKKLRNEKSLTLREVAKALNIDTSMLGKIEKNTRKPTQKFIENIANFFNVSVKDLKIASLSDTVVYKVVGDEDLANEVLKTAEKKVKYLKSQKNS